jgi:hypothetical protein
MVKSVTIHSPKLKQNRWNLDEVMPLTNHMPQLSVHNVPCGLTQDFCTLLSRDVFSEGDAKPLYDYVMTRQQALSPHFLQLLNLWIEDEQQHYEALRRVYCLISGISFKQMDQHFDARIHEIEPIQRVLTDEFTMLVTLMFDEIGSVYSYRRDLWEYYRHFGTAVQRIGQHLVQDEGQHFNNAAELLLSCHQHRLGEVKDFLEELDLLEKGLGRYCKTFFLDHAQEQHRFPLYFNSAIIQIILSRLGLGNSPSPRILKSLWQWIPDQ